MDLNMFDNKTTNFHLEYYHGWIARPARHSQQHHGH